MLWSEGTLCHCLHSRELIQNPLGRVMRSSRESAPAGGGPTSAAQSGCREPPPNLWQEHACSSELWQQQWQKAAIFAVTWVTPVCETAWESVPRASNSLLGLYNSSASELIIPRKVVDKFNLMSSQFCVWFFIYAFSIRIWQELPRSRIKDSSFLYLWYCDFWFLRCYAKTAATVNIVLLIAPVKRYFTAIFCVVYIGGPA